MRIPSATRLAEEVNLLSCDRLTSYRFYCLPLHRERGVIFLCFFSSLLQLVTMMVVDRINTTCWESVSCLVILWLILKIEVLRYG
jgi:hypothetical protein